MNRSIRMLGIALVAPLLASACKKDSDDNATPPADTTTVAAAPAPAPAATDTGAAAASGVNDAQIAAIVLAANSADSAGGVLAKQKGTNPKVKQFGERMTADHGGVNKQAVALAGRLNLTPEENATSRQLTQGGQQTQTQLGTLSGAAFDRGYIDHEVEYHETVLDAIDKTLLPGAQNADLKALLQQVRPAVAAHLDMARAIQKELQGS